MKPLPMLAVCLIAALLASGGQASRRVEPRVGYVAYSGATPTRRTLEGIGLYGFVQAMRRLPIRGRVEHIAPGESPEPALQSLSEHGYNLIVAPLFSPDAIDPFARSYPNVHFLALDVQPDSRLPPRPNVHRIVFRSEEAAYLAGYLSALMADRKQRGGMLSAVGGLPTYGVHRWIVGFRAGARRADPLIHVRVDYSGDFLIRSKCRRLALSQIAAGSSVVFDVAGDCGVGALEAARKKHVWGVGVDVDQSFLGPYILTSAVDRHDRAVFDAIRRFLHGRLGAQTVYDLRSGGVQLGKVSPKVPASVLRKVQRIRRLIVDGTISVPRPTH